jgi:hypothetical protein
MADTTQLDILGTDPEVLGLQRQRQLANLLTGQAFNAPQGQMISGRYVKPSGLQQALPMINAAIGGATGVRLDTEQQKIAEMLRGKGDEAAKDVMETYKTDPNLALQKATQYQQFPQVKALLPQLSKVALPEATTLEREYTAAKQQGYSGNINDFKNQMTKYQEMQAANDKQRLGLEAARFNLEKSKAEVNPAEAPLRTSFLGQIQPHVQISQAYRKIEAAPETAAGDMSRIFGYMKILDPGSTVREGEYASAENARGVPDSVRAQYNRVMSGQRLTPKQREEFTQSAGDLVNSQKTQFETQKKYYTDIASQNRINPANVIYDPYADLNIKTTPPKAPKQDINAGQQLNIPQAGGNGGWNIINIIPSRQ